MTDSWHDPPRCPDGNRRVAPAPVRLAVLCWAFDGRERARTEWRLRADAGTLIDEFPGVALVVDLGRRGAGGAGTGSAIVLAFERHAVAFLLGAGPCRRRDRSGGQRGSQRRSDRERHGDLLRHEISPFAKHSPSSVGGRVPKLAGEMKYRPTMVPIAECYATTDQARSCSSAAMMASGSMRSRNSVLTCRALTRPSRPTMNLAAIGRKYPEL